MTKLILLAGAAALVGAAPAVAKPGGGPHGHGMSHATMSHPTKSSHGMSATHMSPKGAAMRTARADRNRNGIADADEALARKYGGALCPPGLYKKTPSCMPPGQAKRAFRDGQRVPTNYRYYTPYSDIPVALRDRYNLNDQYRYIYRNNVIYQVDPKTQLISNIINAVL